MKASQFHRRPCFGVVLLLLGLVSFQIPQSEGFDWSWTSFKNRLSNTFNPSTSVKTTTSSYHVVVPTPPPRVWSTTGRVATNIYDGGQVVTRNANQNQKQALTCACGEENSPVCASNGITYKNTCKFQCSKKRVPRLRIVQNGSCANLNKNDYWSGKNRGY